MTNIEKAIVPINSLFESIWNILSYPGRYIREDLGSAFLDMTQKYGLDPIYVCTVFMNLVALAYWRNFRNWETQSDHVKHLAIMALVFTGFLNLWSLLKLLSIIDL